MPFGTVDEASKHPPSDQALMAFAIFRLESAVWTALCLLLIFFYPKPFSWWHWWIWATWWLIGETVLILATIWDRSSEKLVRAAQFREQSRPGAIKHRPYRRLVRQALATRDDLYRHAEAGAVLAERIDDLVLAIYRLANLLDRPYHDPAIARYRTQAPRQLTHAQAQLKIERNAQARAAWEETIRRHQAHLTSLEELDHLIECAEQVLQRAVIRLQTLATHMNSTDPAQAGPDADETGVDPLAGQLAHETEALLDIIQTLSEVHSNLP